MCAFHEILSIGLPEMLNAKKLEIAKIRPNFLTKRTKFWQPTKKIIDTFFVDLEILERMAQCCHQQKWQPFGL